MTKEEAKEWLPILTAYAEGKTIQVRKPRGEWTDLKFEKDDLDSFIAFISWDDGEFRIKPTPTYRPFKSGWELAAEFCKRFGVERKAWEMPQIWVRYTVANNNIIHLIYGMDNDGVKVNDATASLKYLFESYTFLDGSPCGVEEAGE